MWCKAKNYFKHGAKFLRHGRRYGLETKMNLVPALCSFQETNLEHDGNALNAARRLRFSSRNAGVAGGTGLSNPFPLRIRPRPPRQTSRMAVGKLDRIEVFMTEPEQEFQQLIKHYIELLRKAKTADDAWHSLIELDVKALPILQQYAASEPDDDIRARLVNIVWEYRRPETVSFLAQMLNDRSKAVWKSAINGLLAIGSADLLTVLKTARARASGERAEYIDEAISQIGEPWVGRHGQPPPATTSVQDGEQRMDIGTKMGLKRYVDDEHKPVIIPKKTVKDEKQRMPFLLKVLVIILVIWMALAIAIPVLAPGRHRVCHDLAIMHNLQVALDNYLANYGTYPVQPGKRGFTIDDGTVPYDTGYYQTECAPVGKEANGRENNSALIKVLFDTNYLDKDKTILENGNLVDSYGTPFIFRFLVLPMTDINNNPIPGKLTENVYIWSYGPDKKNWIYATPNFTNAANNPTGGGPALYDLIELNNMRTGDGGDNICTWR